MASGRSAAIALTLLVSAAARADEYSEFRTPSHRLYGWNVTAMSSATRNASAQDSDNRSGRLASGAVGTQGFWIADSDPARTAMTWNATIQGNRSTGRHEQTTIGIPIVRMFEETRDTYVSESWGLTLERRVYPRRPPVALELSAGGGGQYEQAWSHVHEDDQQDWADSSTILIRQLDRDSWRWRYIVSGSVAFGVGRVRDATGVLDARVYEQRLRHAGVLSRPLSRTARERLAALAYLQYAYASVLDRPAKSVWPEVERILREDDALRDQAVNPYAVLRAAEPYLGSSRSDRATVIARSPLMRLTGGFAGIVFAATHTQFIDRLGFSQLSRFSIDDTSALEFSGSGSTRNTASFDQVSGGGKCEFHRPLGPLWQVDATTQALFPLETPHHGFQLISSLSIRAIVADRWAAGVFASQMRSTEGFASFRPTRGGDSWDVTFGADLTIFLEDRLQLGIRSSELQRASLIQDTGRSFYRTGQLSLDLSYRFWGGLDAPGLIMPLKIGSSAF